MSTDKDGVGYRITRLWVSVARRTNRPGLMASRRGDNAWALIEHDGKGGEKAWTPYVAPERLEDILAGIVVALDMTDTDIGGRH